jgi:hypothetical protein
VPFIWAKVHSSPPHERRKEIRDACAAHGGRLCENEIYYSDGDDVAFALIQVPADAGQRQQLLDAINAIEWSGLVDVDEKQRGDKPPPPGHRP